MYYALLTYISIAAKTTICYPPSLSLPLSLSLSPLSISLDLASSLNQPAGPYSYGVDSRLPPRQDSTQSDTVMFGMSAMSNSLAQQNKSGSDACLLNTGRGEMKPSLGMASAGSGLGGYNDLSWLNIDNSTFLSSSPNMSSYCGDMMSSLGPTVSMNDNFPLLNEGMVRSGNPTLNEFANHSEMNPFMDSVTSGPFATDNSQLLDLHLNSWVMECRLCESAFAFLWWCSPDLVYGALSSSLISYSLCPACVYM